MSTIISVINLLGFMITILVILKVVLSYFMSPYHPMRQTVDSVVEPLLAPIRRFMPQTGMLDFSPMVLLILVQIITRLLVGFLITL